MGFINTFLTSGGAVLIALCATFVTWAWLDHKRHGDGPYMPYDHNNEEDKL